MGCKAAYEAVDPWRNFWNIEEMDFSGINVTTSDDNTYMRIFAEDGTITVSGISDHDYIMVYDTQGRIVYSGIEHTITNLPHGIYIVKVGTSTVKVLI